MVRHHSERVRLSKLLTRERRLWKRGVRYVAGVDEAGRGPLAGPVVAAAVVFPKGVWIPGVDDSKKLSRAKRESLFLEIQKNAISVGIGVVSHQRIDVVNIRQASLVAMEQAISRLNPKPEYLLIDGNYFRDGKVPYRTIVGGDAKSFSIASASIVAKVTRDRLMEQLHLCFPLYGFDRHKGYATKAHLQAIEKYGLSNVHRRSFHVRALFNEESPLVRQER